MRSNVQFIVSIFDGRVRGARGRGRRYLFPRWEWALQFAPEALSCLIFYVKSCRLRNLQPNVVRLDPQKDRAAQLLAEGNLLIRGCADELGVYENKILSAAELTA